MNVDNSETKSAGPIAPFDEEVNAMREVAKQFDPLNEEQRQRVWGWLAHRYRLGMRGGW